jgi:hypothetical protein
VFADDILAPMFATTDATHAERLCWFLELFMEVSNRYNEERGGFATGFENLHLGHARSQARQERLSGPPGSGCPGRPFTDSQRLRWKDLFLEALRQHPVMSRKSTDETLATSGDRPLHSDADVSAFIKDFADFIDRGMRFYAPFVRDRDEVKK